MPSVTGSLSGLINDISASVTNLVNDISGRPTDSNVPAHPLSKDVEAILSEVRSENWLKLSFPYTFSVVDVTGQSANPFTDFSLPLAPRSITQSEDFAISIKPTQGGTTVTHSGNRYKTLTIEGTTGIAPFRGSGGVNRRTGEAIFQPNQLKYRSGYEVFLRLRNWFRAYYEYKKNQGKAAQSLRLIFKNYKDGEFLIVELENFEMDRQAARPHLYDYKLQLKVLAHLNFMELSNTTTAFESAIEDATELILQARGVFLRSQGILRQIESTYSSVILEPLRQTTLALKALQGVGLTAADVGSKIINNTVDAAKALAIAVGLASQFKTARTTGELDPNLESVNLPNDIESAVANQGSDFLNTLNEGLLAIDSSEFSDETINAALNEQSEAQQLPRSFYTKTIRDLTRVRRNAEDFFNLGSTEYDSLFNRTSTLKADSSKTITNEELDVLNAFNDSITAIRLLLSTEDLFKSTFDERIQDMINRFDGNIILFSNVAVKQINLPQGITLERLAQQELGDSTRWGEIVEVNNLKPPYIVDDPTSTLSNVKKPGDKILIPVPLQNGFSQVPQAKEIKTTKNLNDLERSLGTDLKLTKDYDLSITPSGDLEVVSGASNLAQAVLLKLSYEPKEVIRYPELGAGILPGQKFPALADIQDGVVNTLLQDTRIQSVEGLSLRRESSALFLSFNIKVKQIDIPIPINIKL